ncbi:hypothetical protein BC828DRAFT_394350 [Blastocladiella britannica]|nr:hypothetical protein BC828DRAFT_394350 [Blastocladiella britannica]
MAKKILPMLVLDRILAFAAHRVYSLADALVLGDVMVGAVETRRWLIQRLVQPHTNLDLISVYRRLTDRAIARTCLAASAAGHVRALERTSHTILGIEYIFYAAIAPAQISVMDWCFVHLKQLKEDDLDDTLASAAREATRCCHVAVLQWIKDHFYGRLQSAMAEINQYSFSPLPRHLSADRMLATFDWWSAELAWSHKRPIFRSAEEAPVELACCVANGAAVVDWWRRYCYDHGYVFQWPAVVTKDYLWYLIKYDRLDSCRQMWAAAAMNVATAAAAEMLDLMCECGRTDFLDWVWEDDRLRDAITAWRPRRPFSRLDVIEWFGTRAVDAAAFEIVLKDECSSRLESLFRIEMAEVEALDWWWARRDRFGLAADLSPQCLSVLSKPSTLHLLQWYLDRCSPVQHLPVWTLTDLAAVAACGRIDIAEQVWGMSSECGHQLLLAHDDSFFDSQEFDEHLPVATLMDYLWEFYRRAGVPFPLITTTSVAIRHALQFGDLDAVRWWYAMHRVHGTGFLSAEELRAVECAPGSQLARWIQLH